MIKAKKFFTRVFIFLFCIAVFFCAEDIQSGISSGVKLCLNTLIPSLFPFMFISSFIVQYNTFNTSSKFSRYLARKLFKLPSCCIPVIILSAVGGYPCGANGIKNLINENRINNKQAEYMACFCVGAGPAYVINVVGISVFHSFKLGIILFLAQLIAFLVIMLIFVLNFRADETYNNYYKEKTEFKSFSELIVNSCKDSTISMLNICSFVVLFSSFIAIISSCNIIDLIIKPIKLKGVYVSLISCFLEISTGTCISAENKLSPMFFSFFLAFGGLCVFFQIFSLLKNIKINKFKFILARILQAVLATSFTYALLKIFPIEIVSANIEHTVISSNGSQGSVALLFMSLMFLISVFFTDKNRARFTLDKQINHHR